MSARTPLLQKQARPGVNPYFETVPVVTLSDIRSVNYIRVADNTSDNKVLPLRPHRVFGSTIRPAVIRPLPVRLQERACAQALYQASPPASSAQEKRGRGRSICG